MQFHFQTYTWQASNNAKPLKSRDSRQVHLTKKSESDMQVKRSIHYSLSHGKTLEEN